MVLTTIVLRSKLWVLGALAVTILQTGCTDMQFVNAENLLPQQDPREDIVLTNVSATMTSAGLVQQRIQGDKAVFSQSANELTIKQIKVAMLGEDRSTRSITQADLGQIYFADRPAEEVGRRDMRFAGDVLYRSPQNNDPTTDSMRLTSELIIWDESEQKFKSPEGYEMLLLPKGQAPIRQFGKGFEATQDLTRFVVRTGVVTTEIEGDPTARRKEMEKQFDVWRSEVDRATANKPVKPQLIELPER